MSIKTLAALAALAAAPLAAQTPITPGQTVTGTLREGDRQLEDGAYYDAYVIRGRPGEAVVVRMTSEDFDTYLYWGYEDDDGEWVDEDENDDFGDGTDSRLVVRLDDDGAYELRAAGFDEDQEGTYELRVSPAGEPRPMPLRVGQVVQGELSESDHDGEEGYEDHYVIRGRPGTVATIDAGSDDFDTYLRFGVWRDGELDDDEEDDDGGQGTNSQMVVEFENDTEYRVIVHAFDGEGSGAYTLRVREGDVSDPDDDGDDWSDDEDDSDDEWSDDEDESDDVEGAEFGQDVTVLPVTAGEPVEVVLGEGSFEDEEGSYYFDFTYEAAEGEELQVRVSSEEVDSYVLVGTGIHDDFDAIVEDDDSGPGLDAELTWTVPEDGEYTIRVTTANPLEAGALVLRVRSTR